MSIPWMILGLFYLAITAYDIYESQKKGSVPSVSLAGGEILVGLLWVYAAYVEGPLLAYVIIISGLLRLGVGIFGIIASYQAGNAALELEFIFPFAIGVVFLFLGFRRLSAPAVIGGRRR